MRFSLPLGISLICESENRAHLHRSKLQLLIRLSEGGFGPGGSRPPRFLPSTPPNHLNPAMKKTHQ